MERGRERMHELWYAVLNTRAGYFQVRISALIASSLKLSGLGKTKKTGQAALATEVVKIISLSQWKLCVICEM